VTTVNKIRTRVDDELERMEYKSVKRCVPQQEKRAREKGRANSREEERKRENERR